MGHLTQLEVMRLKPGTKYEFRIRANNDLGSSVWSRKSKVILTNREAQMGAPVNGRVIERSKTSLLISWEVGHVFGPTDFGDWTYRFTVISPFVRPLVSNKFSFLN